ncbi:hypothetical protein [Streptomyces tauricus]|uniref:hypothetical protein n=1 Tax=Streptomyces tauricus TaxID=68274 RepID=UPI002243C613|nr:hypothetical protein [Streptomyces tauricus]MCW8103314.1 hypothetical protein [Streptomyces tauricus]
MRKRIDYPGIWHPEGVKMACDGSFDAIVRGFFSFLTDPVGTIIDVIASRVLESAIKVFGDLLTTIPTLDGGTSKLISSQTQWVVIYTAVGSLLFASGRMALERRGEAGGVALKGLVRLILVAGGATAVVTAAASLSDRYSDFLFKTAASDINSLACTPNDGDIPSFAMLILAFLLLIGAVVQMILLYVRLGVMIILLGTLPLAAAASMTDWGGGWWRKHVGWMVAWLLYKPAAGLIIYSGTAMVSSRDGDNNTAQRIAGIAVLLLSALALPALLKLVIPATAALGTGGQGSTQAIAGSLASGAKSIGSSSLPGSGSGSAGAAGGAGAAGPSGAQGAAGGAGSAGGAAAGATRAAAAAGPVGAAASAAMTAASTVGNIATGAVAGADGDRGHNR